MIDAQTPIYCDNELFIFLIHNDLEGLINCVNLPDLMQDAKIEELDQRIDRVENRTVISNEVK
jgi:hypothetical protein